jgi:hypothetical protein
MAVKYTHHPKRSKSCVFCNYWIGDAKMKFVNSVVGYSYDGNVSGQCTKRNGSKTPAVYSCGKDYEPSIEAKKLL